MQQDTIRRQECTVEMARASTFVARPDRDLVSVSRVSRPFLRVSVLKVSGLVSASRATSFETLNIAKKWFRPSKISAIQRFLFVVFAGKKHPKQARKYQKFEKNST